MQELARNMNYSEPYFCKLFKQCFNKNFTSYLTEYLKMVFNFSSGVLFLLLK